MSDKVIGRRELLRGAAIAGAGLGALGTGTREAQAARARLAVDALDRVPTTELGTTGAQIPILLMGCSQRFDPAYDKTLHRAFKEGVNYIDTAQAYSNGQSHKTLAPFLEQVGRENLWITSKVMLGGSRATPEAYKANIDKMLPDLGTDRLEMFFMHGVNDARLLDPEFIRMSEDLKKAGRTQFFGFSCHDGNVVELMNKAAKIGAPGIDAIMFRYNFTKYGDLELNKAIDAAKNAGIGLIAMKTMSSVPEDENFVKQFQSENFTLPQAKLKAVWADERIDAATSEMMNVQQVRENTAAAKSLTQLSMREFHQLHQYAAATAENRCQGCNEICESRVDGDLKIADQLRYLMYDECYGNSELARRRYRELGAGERDARTVELSAATAACPQGIDIARRLEEAHKRLA